MTAGGYYLRLNGLIITVMVSTINNNSGWWITMPVSVALTVVRIVTGQTFTPWLNAYATVVTVAAFDCINYPKTTFLISTRASDPGTLPWIDLPIRMERHLNAAPWNMIHEMGLFWRMDVPRQNFLSIIFFFHCDSSHQSLAPAYHDHHPSTRSYGTALQWCSFC